MRENFIYENHLGQRFDGLANGVYLNQSDLRNYAWNYRTINNRISGFYRGIRERNIPLVVHGMSADEATAAKNRLLEVAEADIYAVIPGKVIIGDYYTMGYIIDSAKSDFLKLDKHTKIRLKMLSEDPAWYREKMHSFIPGGGNVAGGSGMDYPYDYPFDYAVSHAAQEIICDSIGSNAFRIRIYGAISNPAITIAGHTYSVNGTIAAGETLLIDSTTKKITLTKADGSKVNWFDNRNRESYIFQEISAGQHTVIWNEAFGFDLTIIEKRSEPRWT